MKLLKKKTTISAIIAINKNCWQYDVLESNKTNFTDKISKYKNINITEDVTILFLKILILLNYSKDVSKKLYNCR